MKILHKISGLKNGFTLVELLTSMTVLTILVLVMGKVFTESTKMFQEGTKKAEINNDGRSVVSMIAKELSLAVADRQVCMRLKSDDVETLGVASDDLYFAAYVNDERAHSRNARTYRTAEMIGYFVRPMADYKNRFELVRLTGRSTSSIVYREPSWYADFDSQSNKGALSERDLANTWTQVIAENIRTFEVFLYDAQGQPVSNFSSVDHGPPLYAEVYLELLGERDALKVENMAQGLYADLENNVYPFCDKAVKRFVSRVYFHNSPAFSRIPVVASN